MVKFAFKHSDPGFTKITIPINLKEEIEEQKQNALSGHNESPFEIFERECGSELSMPIAS